MDPVLLLEILILLALLVVIGLQLWGRSRPDPATCARFDALEKNQERAERGLREELGRNREELTGALGQTAQAVTTRLDQSSTTQQTRLDRFADGLAALRDEVQKKLETGQQQIGEIREKTLASMADVRTTVDTRLKALQEENAGKLEQMRAVVDEKLQTTLDRRLSESFRVVSERLELVHKGLGEMQTLAHDVGNLQRVLTNVKTRGVWGEIQLGTLLEQVLTPDQYATNVAVQSQQSERVEYAIRLPGTSRDESTPIWLPIDAKFPLEEYQRLTDAAERADAGAADQAGRQLETQIRGQARLIRERYIHPPQTTDFAIMFLPTEGLYAEVLRRPGLASGLQRDYRVVVAGPTTLAALLNSLQMGFRTLAIERRSSEVWQVLGGVKKEFQTYQELLVKVQKKLSEASNVIEDELGRRTRVINRRLRAVEERPVETQLALEGFEPETEDAAASRFVSE